MKRYHLAFHSKRQLGMKFWRQARKYSHAQMDLFEKEAGLAQRSQTEWTDATWNPVTGCTKISPECKF